MEIWILFSVANQYYQPEKAFEKIYWEEPTKEERKRISDLNENSSDRYWIEKFKKPKK